MSDKASKSEEAKKDQVEGTCLVVGAACVFALVALVVKNDRLPVLVATELRFLVSWAIAIAFMLVHRKSRGLHWFGPPELRTMLLLKCAMSFAFITLWWTALRHAPVGDCIALVYTSPVMTALLSRMFLGESLPMAFPFQAGLVSAGVILVLDPPFIKAFLSTSAGATSPDTDYTYTFMALCVSAFIPIITRQTRDCSWIEVEHVSACLACTVLDPGLLLAQYLLYGSVPTLPAAAPHEIGLILLAACGSFVGIGMETKGYQLAEVGKAAMFRYLEVPFAFFLQHVGTSQPVREQALLGSLFIVGSCFLGLRGRTNAEDDEKMQALLEHDSAEALMLCTP